MLSDALFWSGRQFCGALTSMGISYSTISACGENPQIIGFLLISWVVMMIIIWKLLIGRLR
jgi:hypothetical protein